MRYMLERQIVLVTVKVLLADMLFAAWSLVTWWTLLIHIFFHYDLDYTKADHEH